MFSDPEGLATSCASATPTAAARERPEIPAEHALQGFDGVRAYTTEPAASEHLLGDMLGFERGRATRLAGARRAARRLLRLRCAAAREPTAPGSRDGAPRCVRVAAHEQEAWRERVAQAGARPTPVIDRFYFRSVYFREPSGVLFEIATIGPGLRGRRGRRAPRRAPVAAAASSSRCGRASKGR